MEIHITQKSDDVFEVSLQDTHHNVTLDDVYWEKLTEGKISKEELIQASFRFLLDREPAQAILSAFHLREIADYFPEYESTLKHTL